MRKIKYRNKIIQLDNIDQIELAGKSLTFKGDMLSRFTFENDKQAEGVYIKIFLNNEDLDLDSLLKEK